MTFYDLASRVIQGQLFYTLFIEAVTKSHPSSGGGGIDYLLMRSCKVSEEHVGWDILLEITVSREGENEKMSFKYLAVSAQ